jgi:hypothetical protein
MLSDTFIHFHSAHSQTSSQEEYTGLSARQHIREKLDVRQMEGFINGGWKLYSFPSVFPLDLPTVKLS